MGTYVSAIHEPLMTALTRFYGGKHPARHTHTQTNIHILTQVVAIFMSLVRHRLSHTHTHAHPHTHTRTPVRTSTDTRRRSRFEVFGPTGARWHDGNAKLLRFMRRISLFTHSCRLGGDGPTAMLFPCREPEQPSRRECANTLSFTTGSEARVGARWPRRMFKFQSNFFVCWLCCCSAVRTHWHISSVCSLCGLNLSRTHSRADA